MGRYKEHQVQTRVQIVQLLEQGYGAWAIATHLNLPRNTVVQWVERYRRHGDEGLIPVTKYRQYSWETKVAAAEAFLAGKVRHEVLEVFQIRSHSALERWVRIYRDQGVEGLRQSRPPGRPRKHPVPAAEETLEEKVQRLEMENAALKKLQALAALRQQRD